MPAEGEASRGAAPRVRQHGHGGAVAAVSTPRGSAESKAVPLAGGATGLASTTSWNR
jgi:hypothetical protein